MLYVEYEKIKLQNLKAWVKSWDADKFIQYWKNQHDMFIPPKIEKQLFEVINAIKSLDKFDGDNYYEALFANLSRAVMDTYFRFDHSSIKVANLYEVLIEPNDIVTKKKLIKGYDFESKKFGSILIHDNDKCIGTIGTKSDLFWRVFYEEFIVEEEDGTVPVHTHDHDNYLTLQLWNIDLLAEQSLEQYVQEILYQCAVKFDLHFQKAYINPLHRQKGHAEEYVLNFKFKKYEAMPLLYYNAAFENKSARIKFLSYYQVIEYYYVRANNLLLRDELIEAGICSPDSFDARMLPKLVGDYNKRRKEQEALKLVLSKAISVPEIREWLQRDTNLMATSTDNKEAPWDLLNINLATGDKAIVTLAKRIYSLRCSIVHSKADIGEVIFIPNLNDNKLVNEIPLMAYVAEKVLETWGQSSYDASKGE